PQDGTRAGFTVTAVRENGEIPVLLVQTNSELGTQNPQHNWFWMLSSDGGATWKHVLLPNGDVGQFYGLDLGGPWTKSQFSPIRTGTAEYPFVVCIPNGGVLAIGADGSSKLLVPPGTSGFPKIVGSSKDGARFLVRIEQARMISVGVNGATASLPDIDQYATYDGWLAPDGTPFLLLMRNEGRFLVTTDGNAWKLVLGPYNVPLPTTFGAIGGDPNGFFAVPSADFNGAWMIQRGTGKPTTLSRYTRERGVEKQWEDISGPQVEALIAGESGSTVLIQVHRDRPLADQRIFKDPALAVWHTGQPAPRFYDELYLNETTAKGFVHLDVDKVESGDPFVFDSGGVIPFSPGIIISPGIPSSGGGDVIQEWGVVRGSLSQRLVLPGIARTPGAYGSSWSSDVIFHNPLATKQNVSIRYVPAGDGPSSQVRSERVITLDPHEIRLIPDALKTLFFFETGGGAFFITPDEGVDVTSRTYSTSAAGSYGFGMNAIDVYAAASPRFPVTFAGALQGTNFRTNIVLTDVSGRGSDTSLAASGNSGAMGLSNVFLRTPTLGQQQYNGLATLLGVQLSDTGAVVVQPTTGETIATVFTIDNRTNDPTYFPPDLPAPFVRTIPAIGHLDGANNSKFRSDLFLFNPAREPRTVTLQAKMWDTTEQPISLNLTMLPNEARVIRDVLSTAFGRTGIARLRYLSSSPDNVGVRVTSRTYNVDENGGTYGFLMPPLNNFQSASAGDSLEILGAVGDKRFRTNVGLVELSSGFSSGTSPSVRIEIIDNKGVTVDSFTTTVPYAGGSQLNDIFHSRGLGDGPIASIIRISPLNGMVGAFATMIDNGTNDPTYLAAQLGAKQ
ncbi:MAG: hypothetical protein JWO56_1613, partial [Acidobacteria bacterium]|nr:hypothetical protein [Acidobacteriota bacterium]